MRTSSFTTENSPQNVKKIVVGMPIAAPVVARIICGHTLSSSPLHAMITSLPCGTCSRISSVAPAGAVKVSVVTSLTSS